MIIFHRKYFSRKYFPRKKFPRKKFQYKNICALIIIVLAGFSFSRAAEEPLTGEEIIKRVDDNFSSENSISTSTMIIKGRRGTRTVQSKSWGHGTEKTFTEYLAPAREKGTKMLKLGDELWTWSPSTDRIIKIAGHMLRQSLLGSDISYEDFMEDPNLLNTYTPKLIGEEKIGGRLCYVIELTAKVPDPTYHTEKIWVDKERFLPLREDRFAKSGKLIKRFLIRESFQVGDRWYPKRMNYKDMLKKGAGTELIVDSIEFDVEIPEHIFSKAALRR